MPLYLETFTPGHSDDWTFAQGYMRGWGFDPADLGARLRVDVKVKGKVIRTLVADEFREDLRDNGVGDGRYGFLLFMDFDLDTGLTTQIDDVEIVGRNDATGEILVAEWAERIDGELAQVRARNAAPVQVLGSSFILDNIKEFNPNFVDLSKFGFTGSNAILISRKLEAFGGGMWEGRNTDEVLRGLGACIADLVSRKAAHLILDMSNEGQSFQHLPFWMNLLHEGLEALGLPASGCTLVTQNKLMGDNYNRWCDSTGRTDRLNTESYDYYVRRFVGLRGREVSDDAIVSAMEQYYHDRNALRPRHFLCMNFTPRPHRVAFLSWLFGSGFDTKGYVSFAGFNMMKMNASESPMPANWLQSELLDRGFQILKARGRMTLDLPSDGDSSVPEFDVGHPDFYRQSYFSVVTESEVSDGDLRRITEKVVKPIAMFHPMLVVGNSGSLQLLRDFGFRTFAPFIDESYDLVDDSQTRLNMITAELERLLAMTPEQMTEWYRGLSDILVHNYLHLHRGLNDRFKYAIEPDLIDGIARRYGR